MDKVVTKATSSKAVITPHQKPVISLQLAL